MIMCETWRNWGEIGVGQGEGGRERERDLQYFDKCKFAKFSVLKAEFSVVALEC